MTRRARAPNDDGRLRVSGRIAVRRAADDRPDAVGSRPLRVARTLAVAHEIVRLIADGWFADQADAARALGFTRARITQLVDLTMLAPDIQEELLFTVVAGGRDTIVERTLRPLTLERSWQHQRVAWSRRVTGQGARVDDHRRSS